MADPAHDQQPDDQPDRTGPEQATTGGRADGEAEVADYSASGENPVAEDLADRTADRGTDASTDVHPDSALAADRLEDLRRLQAEYVNYKKRVDRDRELQKEIAIGGVIEALLPVLDDVYMARRHGELADGPFAAIADKLEATLGRFGAQRFGEEGEPFDPAHHEALMHTQADLPEGTTETTIVQVMQPGWRINERIVRAARVAVADPS